MPHADMGRMLKSAQRGDAHQRGVMGMRKKCVTVVSPNRHR